MSNYGKLVEGVLEYAPLNFAIPNGGLIINFNKNKSIMEQFGFKEIIDVKPFYDEVNQYLEIEGYIESDNNIIINYIIIDKPTVEPQETLEERIIAIEEQLAMQSSILDEEVNK